MAILLCVVFGLLVYPIHVAGLTLCDTDGTLEVVESTASNVFTCTGADSNDVIAWTFQPNNGNSDLGTCPPLPPSCNNPYKPQFEASRPAGDRSTLTVNGSTTSYLQYIQGKTIVCKANPSAGSAGSPQQTQCTVDIVAVPNVTCDAHYNTGTSSPRTMTVNCSVTGAYSYLNRYTCNLIQTSPTTNSLGSGSLTVTSTSGSGGKYKTGYCQVTVPYPDVTGVYSYKMAVTPERQDVPVSFGGQSSFEITTSAQPEGDRKTDPGFPVVVVVGVGAAVVVVSAIIVVVVLVIRRRRAPQRNQPSTSQASSSPYEGFDLSEAEPVIKPKPKPEPQHGASAAQVASTDDVYATVNKTKEPQSAPQDSSPVYAVVNKKKKAPAELPAATPGAVKEKPKVRKKHTPKKQKQKGQERKQANKDDDQARDLAQSTSSGPVYGNVTPRPPEPEGSVYANVGCQKDDSAEKDNKPEPEPEGSRTVSPDGTVYTTLAFNE